MRVRNHGQSAEAISMVAMTATAGCARTSTVVRLITSGTRLNNVRNAQTTSISRRRAANGAWNRRAVFFRDLAATNATTSFCIKQKEQSGTDHAWTTRSATIIGDGPRIYRLICKLRRASTGRRVINGLEDGPEHPRSKVMEDFELKQGPANMARAAGSGGSVD